MLCFPQAHAFGARQMSNYGARNVRAMVRRDSRTAFEGQLMPHQGVWGVTDRRHELRARTTGQVRQDYVSDTLVHVEAGKALKGRIHGQTLFCSRICARNTGRVSRGTDTRFLSVRPHNLIKNLKREVSGGACQECAKAIEQWR